MSNALKYRTEIDGLRAIAVLPVVLYHVGLSFPGGFTGVDVFFVISGFLITGIIIKELELGKFSIMTFYERRVRRILPALTAVLAATLTVGYFMYFATEFEQLAQHVIPVSIFLENIKLYTLRGDYWTDTTDRLPLLHMWSLAIEEQFYIFIPILLIILHRFWRKHILLFFIFLYVASLISCIVITGIDSKLAFYMLPTRAWELTSGSLAFLLIAQKRTFSQPAVNQALSALGLLMILAGYFIVNGEQAFPGAWALIPTLGASFFIYGCATTPTLASHLLSTPVLRVIGLLSYSLYLIHWPILTFVRHYRFPDPISLSDKMLILVLSILLSAASWKFIETPFRRLGKRRFSSTTVVALGVCILGLFFVLGKYIRYADGLPGRFENMTPSTARMIALSDTVERNGSRIYQISGHYNSGGIQRNTGPGKTPQVVVFGDSHAGMFAPAFAEAANKLNVPIAFFVKDGRKTYIEDSAPLRKVILADLEKWHPTVIFYIGRWEKTFQAGDNSKKQKTLNAFKELSAHCGQLYVLNQIPILFEENDRASKYVYGVAHKNNWTLPEFKDELTPHTNSELAKQISQLGIPNIKLLNIHDLYINEGNTIYHNEDGFILYRDNDHLNSTGAKRITPLLEPILQNIPEKP